MKCSKCGSENINGTHCQYCGNQYKFPTSLTVITIVTLILSRLFGIICLSINMLARQFLKKGDLVQYEKYLNVSKIVCISSLVVAIILNVLYIFVKIL